MYFLLLMDGMFVGIRWENMAFWYLITHAVILIDAITKIHESLQ